MKKLLLTALIASVLVLPLGNTVLADHEEAVPPARAEEFLPGDAPAQMAPGDSMAPALHGLVLAMLNHDAAVFDPSDAALTWEGLYNMLSLYGQLDSRCELLEEELLLPAETVQDYAAALSASLADLGPLPAELADRFTYDEAAGIYGVVCGSDTLSQVRLSSVREQDGALLLTGTLVYLVDDAPLAQFQATLVPRDNMFGYALTGLSLI